MNALTMAIQDSATMLGRELKHTLRFPLLIVSTIVNDPQNLTQEFLTSTHFKKEPDGSKWSPSACTAR